MPIYIILGNYTQQGIANIKDSPKRREAVKKMVEEAGGKWLAFYYTFGQHDFVSILELPNDEVALEILLKIGSQGNVRTTTLKAFPENEADKVIQKL